MKKRFIIVTVTVLLLLSGCHKNSLENISTQPEGISDISTEQTVVESRSGNGEQESALPPENGQTEAKANEPTGATKTEKNTTGQTTKATGSVTESAAERSTVRTTVPAVTKSPSVSQTTTTTPSTPSTQKSVETVTNGTGTTGSPAQDITLPTVDSGKDKYEVPLIPLV